MRTVLAMRNQEILPTHEHMKLCGEWFLIAQEDAGGYAASFSFVTGLHRAYIETTGYIIPTMIDLAAALNDPRFRASALLAGEWLLSVQHPDGYFTDIDDFKAQVFDTGQVMFGLNRLYHETKDARYLEASQRSADWLSSVQDTDGSWASAGYHRGHPNVYHSRTAAAMLESAQLTGKVLHWESAMRFLHWAAGQQQLNGFFMNCELTSGADPVLHTLVYVLEGFLLAYQITGERKWLEVLLRGAEPLCKAQLGRDLVLRSQYDAQWQVTNAEKCIPGLAQWAGLCLSLHDITKDADWLEAAQLSIYYLKSKQLRGKGILHGALPASVPLWGYYHPLMLPNWAVKFFADALLIYEKHKIAVWQEQEAWVAKCFSLKLDGGGWNVHSTLLSTLDEIVCGDILAISEEMKINSGCALDLGCGEGRYLKHLQALLPNWEFVGIDPSVIVENGKTYLGSAYQIPFPDSSFDMVYAWIVLQHISDLSRALGEIRRVLKPGGVIVVGDRDLFSGRGLLKPWHELKGRWIYPWDSPFRERWYFASEWRHLLQKEGFIVNYCNSVQSPGDRGWRRILRANMFLLIKATKG